MSIALRIVLFVCAVAMVAFTVIGIRKSRMRIEDSLFWVGLSAVILVLSVFPQIAYFLADASGFMAPVNFVFALFIFILAVKCFTMSRRASELENKLKELTQSVAVDRLDHHERMGASKGPDETSR